MRAAEAGATGRVVLVLTGDPTPVVGRPGAVVGGRRRVRFDARLIGLDIAGRATRLRAPVFVLAPATGWSQLLPGQRATATARLAPPRSGELLGAVVLPRAPPRTVSAAGRVQRLAGAIRAGLRRGVQPLPAGPEALLPGLVIGDTSQLSPEVLDQFRATGLTHLVAVSGANLAIVVATVLAITRRLGAGRRLGAALAGLAMLGFVVVARPSPSVLRAAVMSAVVLIGLQGGRRSAALPALGAATGGLVLLDPALARAAGFALSVLATAGIVLFTGPLRRRMPSWLPGWLAEAVAVPLAAQLACTPALVGYFGRLSLVAVPANLLAAPAVPPATVVGVVVALCAPVGLPVARLLARLAQPPASWLLLIARYGADVPGAQIGWPAGGAGAALAVAAIAGAALLIRRRALRAAVGVAAVAALASTGVVTRIAPSWPPTGWAMVACDVGQGDGLVLAAGPGAAVLVDTGPDPEAIDRCLRVLHVTEVPLVILTHSHADHVEGLPGVLRHRRVGGIEIGPLRQPPAESARVARWAATAAVPVRQVVDGETMTAGPVSWQVIAPAHAFTGTDSDPNNSSIVLRVRLPGFTALLTGDIELEAQREVMNSGYDLSADVLKVPHHGSGRQLPELFSRVGARLAVVSVGAGNDYGHPAAITMARLAATGEVTFRTDHNGAVAFLRRGAAVVGYGRRGSPNPALPPRPVAGQPLGADRPGTAEAVGRVAGAVGRVAGAVAPAGLAAHRCRVASDAPGSPSRPDPRWPSAGRDAAGEYPIAPVWQFGCRAPVTPKARSPPTRCRPAVPGADWAAPDILATVTAAPPRMTLAIGEEELLVERAIAAVVAAVRTMEPDAEVTAVTASTTTPGELAEVLSPGLFGGRRCLVLRDAQDAGKELSTQLPGLLASADQAVVVVTHNGSTRGKSLLGALSDMAEAVIRCGKLSSARDRADFITAEVNAAGRRIDAAGVAALLSSVGVDLRELANVAAQLLADTSGTIGEAAVTRHTRGRADATGFAVADRAVEGDLPGALEVLRWALGTGVAPVLVTSSLAGNLRLIGRVAGEGRGSSGRIAKALGQPGWKVDKALRWSRGWTPAGLSAALRAVALADGEVKGAAADPGYAVERAVLAVVMARRGS